MSETTKEKGKKALNWRRCEISCDVDKLKVDIQQTCMKYSTIKQWCYINHDKDDTRPHYHIYLFFSYPVDMYKVADWFQVPINFIEKIKSRTQALLYLIHGDEKEPINFTMENSKISMLRGYENKPFIKAVNFSQINLTDVIAENLTNPEIQTFSKGEINIKNSSDFIIN